ncbi:transmembrane protein 238 isoform X1 [Trachypithecus francoisi]|uniref:transmembrane protein 238 isoform X1 n=1 Tax=Trachypithecus francoisi TaxID=54180 RepID=UPI00141A97C9|nr:transmembrane protein 238 isoform X1 [Trachypithecus francoisi]
MAAAPAVCTSQGTPPGAPSAPAVAPAPAAGLGRCRMALLLAVALDVAGMAALLTGVFAQLQTTPRLQLSGPDCSVQLPLYPWPAGRSLSALPPYLDKKQICLSAACVSGRGTVLGWERRQDGLLPSSTQVGLATPEVRLPLPWGDQESWGCRSPALYWLLLRGDQGGAWGMRISAQTPPLYPDIAV